MELHEDITKLTEILKKNLFPAHLIEKLVNRYITGTHSNHCPRGPLPTTSPTFYFKLPYIGHFSVVTQKKIRHLLKRYCNDLDIKLVFSSFTISNLFGVEDPIPGRLHSRVVYKFTCAGCNACYVGETTQHFSTRVREHLAVDKASYIFKHLLNSERCRALCTIDCFHILDQGSRDGAVVRALASHQCGPGSIPGPGVICGLSLLLVLVLAPRVFLRVLRFSSLHKNQHFQIPIRSGIRGPQVCQSRDCYVLPSLNTVDLFIYLFIYLSRHYQLSTQDKGRYPYSKRTTLPQSTITPC